MGQPHPANADTMPSERGMWEQDYFLSRHERR